MCGSTCSAAAFNSSAASARWCQLLDWNLDTHTRHDSVLVARPQPSVSMPVVRHSSTVNFGFTATSKLPRDAATGQHHVSAFGTKLLEVFGDLLYLSSGQWWTA